MKLLTTTGIIIFENDKPTLAETLTDAIQAGVRDMDNINLSDQTLTGIDLSGISLNGAYFKGASVTDSKFIGCEFEWADFTYSTFKDCDFSKSEFINPYFNSVSFLNCGFRNARIKGQIYLDYEASIFTDSNMTGVQMSNVQFRKSNFSNVSMKQSVLNLVSFYDCYVSGMILENSILHSVQIEGRSNFGNIDITGVQTANPCEIKGFKKTDLEFFSEPFIIEPENKIIVCRINYGNASPFVSGYTWDYESKAVRTKNGIGIYGFTPDMADCIGMLIGQLGSNVRNKMSHAIDISRESSIVLELEVDKRNVLLRGDSEIAFSECNILGKIKFEDFILQHYPQCTELLNLYSKAMDDPDLYGSQYIGEEGKQLNEMQQKKQTTDAQESQLEVIKNFAVNHARPSDIHGLLHWQRVERNGILLAGKTGVDLQALRVFAYSHDMCREDDGGDPEHGMRASQLLKKHEGSLLSGMEERKIYRLCFACEHHTDMLRSGDPLIDACFDADRLDLTRVGIAPDPAKMATEAGAYYAANPDIYKAEIENINV